MKKNQEIIKFRDWIEEIQKQGSISFTKEEAIKELLLNENTFRQNIFRLSQKGKIQRVHKGFYLIIPIEYQTRGLVPPTLYIDQLMQYLKLPYYVALASAAAQWGSTHQALQEFHVITNKTLRSIRNKKIKIRFFTKKDIKKTPVIKKNVSTGQITISTPEATTFDLMLFSNSIGGLSVVATLLSEIKNSMTTYELMKLLRTNKNIPITQRLGFLLELVQDKKTALEIKSWLVSQNVKLIKLNPSKTTRVDQINKFWDLYENENVEPDEV